MVDYITKSEWRNFVSDLSLNERASVRKKATERSPIGATFLSHSSKDADLIPGVITILENHGAIVYIDKKDPELPPYTSKETASTLKRRIDQSRKFILLATENSKTSSWVPWELGLADEKKGLSNVALVPAVEESYETSWTSWEYLGLYDRIVWGKIDTRPEHEWIVLDERQYTATPLGQWLSS
jgi:hypothetical protein